MVAPLAAGVVLGLMDSRRAQPAFAGLVTIMTTRTASGFVRPADRLYQIDMKRHTGRGTHNVEVTPLTNRAFRSTRGLTGGLSFLLLGALATVALSGCGAPSYTYVADSKAGTYYKVPAQWHEISQKDLNAAITAAGGSSSGIWTTAFDANTAPSADHNGSVSLTQPYVYAQVGQLSSTGSAELSYDAMRDLWLPVTSTARQTDASEGFPGTNFTQIRDQTITASQGVHGVRETFQYTFDGVTDTFDEVVLTNADQTNLYTLEIHCTDSCYTHNETNIDTIMSSFTVGSPT
jgi:hypothetical protein